MSAQTFEERLAATGDMEAFWADCQSLFRSGTGDRVLRRLIMARHPMGFPRGATAEETFAMNGQREVVAALCRSIKSSPHSNQPTNNHD